MTKETYLKSVDILLDAYNKGTLFHRNCNACAVGNLVAKACGYPLIKTLDGITFWDNDKGAKWSDVFVTNGSIQEMDLLEYKGEAKRQIDSTGISLENLATIEYAFETIRYGKDQKTNQYLGLVAVLNVMKDMIEEPVECKQEELKVIAKKFKVEV